MTREEKSKSLSSAPHGKLIDFEYAEIRLSEFNGEEYLYVASAKTEDGWKAMLAPRIYHDVPDYTDVEVLKVRSTQRQEIIVIKNSEYHQLSIPISSFKGLKGISLIGANVDKIIDI